MSRNKSDELNVTMHDVDQLHFDRQNPRLAEYGITNTSSDDEIIEILWDAMDVRELVQSIAASGFFKHEQLIVAREAAKGVVIEGNRRLAAVKLLLGSELVARNNWDVPSLSVAARTKLKSLPVVYSSREDAWRYLGFKHVNGPAKWSSFAKARYIADVHREYKVPVSEIADQIGDRHKTVQRLYRGLMVLEQAERENVYNRDNRFQQRFAFSHLYTALDGDGVSSFLNLRGKGSDAVSPVPKTKLKELGELLTWLFGNRKENIPPVVERQAPHLWQLNAVLKSREALAAIRSERHLASAFELSRDTREVFEEALLKAKRELTMARGHLTEGYDNSEDLLRIAGSVAELADDIYNEMERKRVPQKKQRLTKD